MQTFKQFLIEDWGNLKSIDSYFHMIFKKHSTTKKFLGKSSTISHPDPITKLSDVDGAFEKVEKTPADRYVGVLLSFNGVQTALAIKQPSSSQFYLASPDYDYLSIFSDNNKIKRTFGTDFYDKWLSISENDKILITWIGGLGDNGCMARFKLIINVLKAFDSNLKPEISLISSDANRYSTSFNRRKNREDIIPVNDKDLIKKYTEKLKDSLKTRLLRYKATKIRSIPLEKANEELKKIGIPHKIKIDSYIYVRDSNANLNIGALTGDNWSNDNFIYYKIDTLYSPEINQEMENEWIEFRKTYKELKGDDYDISAAAALAVKKKIIPPTAFKIKFGIVNDFIQVVDVEIEIKPFELF